jgi:hypothetical protein
MFLLRAGSDSSRPVNSLRVSRLQVEWLESRVQPSSLLTSGLDLSAGLGLDLGDDLL